MNRRDNRFVRSATLEGFVQAARDVGLDPTDMLTRVGLSMSCVDNHDTLISFDAYLELLARCAGASGCGDFGARAALARGVPDLGPVSLLMREADTVEEAIRLYSTHLSLHSDGTFIHLDTVSDSPIIFMEVIGRTREQSVQAAQFCATGVLLQLRWLTGSDMQPDLLSFAHPRPAESSMLQRVFQCPIGYNQPASSISVDRALLARTPVTSLPFLRDLTRKHLAPSIACSPHSFATRAARVIKQLLPDGDCNAAAIAAHFDIDRRTLNRRLANEQESFSSLLQRVRLETIQWEIACTDFSLTHLSLSSGFQCLSSFSRWFLRSFGCTASEWRQRVAPPRPFAPGISNAR